MLRHLTIAAGLLVAGPVSVRADMVTDWNQTAAATVSSQTALMQFRALAITHGAVFDAVNAVTRSHEPYLAQPEAPPGASAEAAVAAAAHAALVGLYPAQKQALDQALQASLATIEDGPAEDAGTALGREAAAAHLAGRADDGIARQITYKPAEGAGSWRPTPPGQVPFVTAFWAEVRPFLLLPTDEIAVPGPLPIASPAYAAEIAEVRRLGGSRSVERTADQTAAALFTLTSGAALWSAAARAAVSAKKPSLVESARAFAVMNAAAADAVITGWQIKVKYGTWRPITAIRDAAVDPDPAWEPLLVTPAHPDYVSGHCINAGAAAGVLRRLLGGDGVPFTATLTLPTGSFGRRFESLTAAEKEIGDGRVWAGIHTRTADEHGALIGARIAEIAVGRAMRPLQETERASAVAR